jgi:hypothetical protein
VSERKNVFRTLVFPGSTEIGLEIQRALAFCKEVLLYSAGCEETSHAPFAFVKHYSVPNVRESGWLEALNEILRIEAIDYIFPAHDDVLLALSENASRMPARVVTSPVETCQITRFKSKTYRHLASSVPVPRVFAHSDDIDEFPIFLKPDRGQGSQETTVIDDRDALAEVIRRGLNGKLLLEFLPGAEYTIDCFSDRDQGLMFCAGRERVRTRNGIAMHSRCVDNPLFEEYARRIGQRLELHGAWFFQLKRDRSGNLRLLEVAPRIAGTMALNRVKGINFPLLSLFEQERFPLRIACNNYNVEVDRALTNRYQCDLTYRTVYVDLDDTLIVREAVNTQIARFLFQCLNRGIRLVLMSRHAGDIAKTLKKYRLHELFDEIIAVGPHDSKASFIHDYDAIFIDDSFRERESVREATGIAAFETGMLELLLDDRA